MARKTTQRQRQGRRSTSSDRSERIIDAALALFAEQGWSATSMSDIATRAGLETAEAATVHPTKAAIVGAFIRRIDHATLEGRQPRLEGSARDRLFDLLMRRFDALNPHKEAVKAIVRGNCAAPLGGLCLGPAVLGAMTRVLSAADLGTRGLTGILRVKGLTLVYANAFRVWLGDDAPDMARTMAALDRGLAQAERLARLCPGTPRQAGAES